LIKADKLSVMLATKAVAQSTITQTYGVRYDLCNLLKALGSNPSRDIAKANLEVPMLPDSSAPRIDASAPTVRTNPPIIDNVGEKLNTFEAATVNGADDELRVT